jgi:hypothetical protein
VTAADGRVRLLRLLWLAVVRWFGRLVALGLVGLFSTSSVFSC